MFKSDLRSLLRRYHSGRIGYKGTLTDRIQRISKRWYGKNIPSFTIGDLGDLGDLG